MSLENNNENNIDEKNIEIKNENNILDNEDNSKTQSNSQKKSEKNSNNSDSESESESENNISKKNNDLNISNNNENQDKIKIDINNNMNLSNLSEDKNNYEILRDFKGKHDFSFKAIIIGDAFVGKSSLINQAIKKQFKTTYAPTLGFDYFVFHTRIKNKIIKLKIWDTCGQEIYKSLVTNFY